MLRGKVTEPFNGKLRDELLNAGLVAPTPKAKVMTERWRVTYKTTRQPPTQNASAKGYRFPAPETVHPHDPASATLRQPTAARENSMNSLT